MRMLPVTKLPGTWLAFACARCGQRIDQAREAAMFDADGQPFKAYYHEECAQVELHQRGEERGGDAGQ